ncbi:hypothetical protein NL676_014499 [Syzygium grande]|nr:hypothetical protein NL676_014499 [Syzygium grande]
MRTYRGLWASNRRGSSRHQLLMAMMAMKATTWRSTKREAINVGLVLITMNEALLWTNARYFLQAAQQLSNQWKLMRIGEDPAVDVWMADNLPNDGSIGIDPWCLSINTAQRWECAFAKKKQKLVHTSTNLVDEVSGYLKENGIEVREYGVVSADVSLLASNQLGPWVFKEIQSDVSGGTDIGSREDAAKNIKSEAEDGDSINFIWAGPGSCCYALYSKLDSDRVLLKQSPSALAKALKNPIELDGLRKAHIRDGAAVVQYLVWLDKQMQEDYGASGYFVEGETLAQKKKLEEKKLMEVTVSDKLESFRASKEHFKSLSFPTISSVGPNAAVNHYAPQPNTCAELDADCIYLFDSGAQSYKALRASGSGLYPEPGYYEDGNFGVRLENVLVVNEADTKFNFDDKGYLSFEHITWALYQSKLIDLSLLTPEEIDWLNTYHSKCRETLAPYLDDAEMAWLKKATEPVCA